MAKISELSAISALDEDDILVIVEDGTTKKVTVAELRRTLFEEGWISDSDTWVYASATTFTIAGVDRTARFTKGTYLRLKQGGAYKYFVVVGSTFSTNTTVTITGGDDYSLANSAITDNWYSYSANPQGHPIWFNFTPTYVGFSSDPAAGSATFSIVGRIVSLFHEYNSGTSNGTSFTLTLPATAASTLAGGIYGGIRYQNNSAHSTTSGMWEIGSGSTTANLYRDWGGTSWTASGSKAAGFALQYPI